MEFGEAARSIRVNLRQKPVSEQAFRGASSRVSDWECLMRGSASRLAAEPQLKSISSQRLETRF